MLSKNLSLNRRTWLVDEDAHGNDLQHFGRTILRPDCGFHGDSLTVPSSVCSALVRHKQELLAPSRLWVPLSSA